MSKWRFEYQCKYNRIGQFVGKHWRLMLEDGPISFPVLRLADTPISVEHPAWATLEHLLATTLDTVEIVPWAPVEVPQVIRDIVTPGMLDRVERNPYERVVWDLAGGWAWLHLPGDKA